MNLFIDTNIFLQFFEYTNEDLEELRKLLVFIRNNTLRLFCPRNLIDEFKRNREGQISKSLKQLEKIDLKFCFPHFCKNYPSFGNLKKLQKSFVKEHNVLVGALKKDISEKTLAADILIIDLLNTCIKLEFTEELYQKAKQRMELGNPPGKKSSIGDRVNWETLLNSDEILNDLYVISDDGDFFSKLNKSKPKEFLKDEWMDKKDGNLIVYTNLSSYFKDHFPDIKLASQIEIEDVINSLASSTNFSDTHYHIGRLNKYSDFSLSQAKNLFQIFFGNNQVRYILSDEDVLFFYENLFEKYRGALTEKELLEFEMQNKKAREIYESNNANDA